MKELLDEQQRAGLARIAEHYGAVSQVEKLREEVAELNLALQRDLANRQDCPSAATVGEMADVVNVIQQVVHLWGLDLQFRLAADGKIARQLKRINAVRAKGDVDALMKRYNEEDEPCGG